MDNGQEMTRKFNSASSSSSFPTNNNSTTIGMEPSLFLSLLTDDQREMVSHLLSKLQHLPQEQTSSSYPVHYNLMSDDDYFLIQQQHLLDEALVAKVYKNIDFINVVLDIMQVLEGRKAYIDVPLSVIQPPQEQQMPWNPQPDYISQQQQQLQRQEHRQQQQQKKQQQVVKDARVEDEDEDEEELRQALQRYTQQKASTLKRKESNGLSSSSGTRQGKKSSRASKSSKNQTIPSANNGEEEKLVEVINVHKKKSRPYDNMMTMLSFTSK